MPGQHEGQDKATDYRLITCLLIAPTGKSVALQDIITEVNLFEDLFSPVMTGNILITDSNDLINKLPIMGYEYLLLAFEKPGSNLQFKKSFRVYRMTDRQRTTEQTETYILHFASEELILNQELLISRAYTEMPISAMITDITKNYLHVKEGKYTITETTGLHTFIIPGWHPFYAINFLSQYALTGTHKSASFMFFEDRAGFHFTPLELLAQQQVAQNILLSPKNAGYERDKVKSDLQIAHESAEQIDFRESFDTLRNIYSGMYSGLLITIDPLKQKITNLPFNGQRQFNQVKHVNRFPILSDSQDRTGNMVTQHYGAFKKTVITNNGHESFNIRPHKLEETTIQRTMYLTGMHCHRISAAIPGNIHLTVGKVILLHIPASEQQEKGGRLIDQMYSGKYLITSLRHKLNRRSYACIAEMSKDSVLNQLQNGSVQTPTLNEMKRS